MSTNQQNKNEEEIDLGSLFVIIGKGFKNFFNFIGTIFKEIFHFIILILVFFRTNFVKITIAAIVGSGIGFVLESNNVKTFASNLLVKPNFNSTKQLYNNIFYYNELVKQKDIVGIQKTFNLDKESAESLVEFKIEPIIDENNIIESYNDFVLSVDTATVRSYSFDKFKASYKLLDYKVHVINVVAEKNDVFNKLDDVILNSVVKNKYFNRIKELTNENLNRTDSLLRQNLVQVDSLRRVYMQVMLEEAKKQSTGTSIDLGGEKRTTKELELFETNKNLNIELKKVLVDKSEKYEVINVISNFQPIGYELGGIIKNLAFQLAVLGALLMILILFLLQINKYLSNYKK